MSPCHHPPPPFASHDTPIVAEVFGTSNIEGMEVFYRLKRVSHLIGLLIADHHREDALSHARMRLLTHLVMSKLQGDDAGLLPSELSRFLGISRNTVSTLLNGLEAQGLIERHLHPDDRRQWLVLVTPEGEALIRARALELAAPRTPGETVTRRSRTLPSRPPTPHRRSPRRRLTTPSRWTFPGRRPMVRGNPPSSQPVTGLPPR